MDEGRGIAAEPVHVVEGPGHGAVAEQDDPVRDADRHHLDTRRGPHAPPGEDAQRPGAVPRIRQMPARGVDGTVGLLALDEVALQVGAQARRQRLMPRVVAGVDMRDPDPPRPGIGRDARELRELLARVPERHVLPARLDSRKTPILRIAGGRAAGRGLERFTPPVAGHELLHEIGLGERGVRGSRETEALAQHLVAEIPGRPVLRRFRSDQMPLLRFSGRETALVLPDAREERLRRHPRSTTSRPERETLWKRLALDEQLNLALGHGRMPP
jgi:hypothetical protein